ncbi:MAG: polysaccharide pyruvyl transferase family protein [Nitrospirota bacterium]
MELVTGRQAVRPADPANAGSRNPTICLLGASFGTGNMGVSALTAGTIKALFSQFPHAELFLLDYGKERKAYIVDVSGKKVAVQLENIRFSKKVFLRNNIALLLVLAFVARAMPFEKLKHKIISGNPCLKRLSEASVVASLAGGDSFSDIYGLGRFIYVALPQLLALLVGKRLVLLPQTIGPFKGAIARNIARHILMRADLIYSRDYDGLDETRSLVGAGSNGSRRVRFCYDVGFVVDPVKPDNANLPEHDHQRDVRPLIGLNVSGLLWIGGYSRDNMFGLKIDYRTFIADLIDFMVRKKDAMVMLVPHVFGTGGESDAVVCSHVYAAQKARYNERLLIASGEYNQSEIKYAIGLCDFFVGSRMHACIAALSQCIPTVSIAYSRKFVGVMRTIGVGELVADPCTLENEQILTVIDRAFDQRAVLRARLEQTMPRVRETVLNLFGGIGDCGKGA